MIVEGEEGLTFFQSFVVRCDSADLSAIEQRIQKYLQARGARLVRIDPDDVTEVDARNIPPAWLANASPEEGILARGGRTWVDPNLEEEDGDGGIFSVVRRWFRGS